jgi:hypothetical protein
MFIVIDSNIWISELGLSTAKGLAAQFFIKKQEATIAIPEVVRREVEINIKNSLSVHCENIKKSHRQLLSIFGKLKEVVLPDENQINECAKTVFDRVSANKISIPFSIESATQSLDKVIEGLPPSGPKNQQFKDGVIWADCLALLENNNVVLVTEDKAFFQNKQFEKGLAENLRKEASERPNHIQIFSSITDLLEKIQEPFELDESTLATEFCTETQDSINRLLEQNGFEIAGEATVKVAAYVTEKVDHLFIEFDILYHCNDTRGGDRTQAILTLQGEATFNTVDRNFLNFRNRGECLDYIDADGEKQRKNVVIMVGNIVIGHRDVEHIVRHKIA